MKEMTDIRLGWARCDKCGWQGTTGEFLYHDCKGQTPTSRPRKQQEEARTMIEIRRNGDGSLDEVVAHGAFVHLEQMDVDEWFLLVKQGDTEVRVFLSTPYWTVSARRKITAMVEVDE